jgi:endonuclease/exonuclease/phosphatase family metal-dependent hydrolase
MELSVLQWNVLISQRIEPVGDFLVNNPHDIICLQELASGFIEDQEMTWEYLAHRLGYDYHVQEIPVIKENGDEYTQANAIFSRIPILGNYATWLYTPPDPEVSIEQRRGYMEITVSHEKGPITIGTTQMSWEEKALEEDTETHNLLALTESRQGRYILTGDLNYTPESKRIAAILERLRNAGPPFDVKTWPTKAAEFGSGAIPRLDKRLDYIFVTPDVRVIEAGRLETDVSDHLPIYARVAID